MGKSLIIKGADFSVNGIPETLPSLDITSLVADSFHARTTIGSYAGGGVSENSKRCCFYGFEFSEYGIDISQYSTIEMKVKNGFDYLLGTTPALGQTSGAKGWDGSTPVSLFAWVTDNQAAEAIVDNTTLVINANFRYDDNTTEFSDTVELTDIVDSIKLIP